MVDTGLVEQYRDILASSGETSRAVLYNNPANLFQSLTKLAIANTSLPSSPVRGQLAWYINKSGGTPDYLAVWDGDEWITTFPSVVIVAGTLPANPYAGELVYDTTTQEFWLWDESASAWIPLYPQSSDSPDPLMIMGG